MTAGAATILRRGTCPGLSAPMPTGDGLLVRLMPIGTVALDAFAMLCAAANAHGNGIIEVTARGSIQVRGLTPDSAKQFAATVAGLGIAAADGIPVITNPLAGLDPAEVVDAGTLAADLRLALAAGSLASRLAPKVSVAIDGGGDLGLDALAADLHLRAETIEGDAAIHISIGGNAAGAAVLGRVAAAQAVEAAMRVLEVIARGGRHTRARDILASEGIAVFCSAIEDLLVSPARPGGSGDSTGALDARFRGNERKMIRDVIGVHRLRGGKLACGIGLAFGQSDAATLQRLAAAAKTLGASGVRTAAGRALVAIGLMQRAARSFTAAAKELGYIIDADDPRRHVVACAGAPICASALIPARALAPLVAATAAPYLGGTVKIHISGCAKGCAHPAPAALTIVGSPEGCALVAGGCARDAPFAVAPAGELAAAIGRFCHEQRQELKHESGHV